MLRRHLITVLALGFCCVFAQGQAPIIPENNSDCSQLNYSTAPFVAKTDGRGYSSTQHVTGYHGAAFQMNGECSYTGKQQATVSTYCQPQSNAMVTTQPTETGAVTPSYTHTISSSDVGGVASGAAGTAPTANAAGATAVNSCQGIGVNNTSCIQIGISFSWSPTSWTPNFGPPTPIWTGQELYSNQCNAYVLNPSQVVQCPNPNPSTPPYSNYGGANWQWNPYTCQWVNTNGASPIAIDTKGGHYHGKSMIEDYVFTDPNKPNGYVSFDIDGSGRLAKLSWIKHKDIMWLALPDANGTVATGKQLFGNFTDHSDGAIPGIANSAVKSPSDYNGFLALRWYDLPDNGGNADGVIDSKDAIWSKLRLWQPSRCLKQNDAACQSEPAELHTLDEFGITSISLNYSAAQIVDANGNNFKFFSIVNPDVARDADGNISSDNWGDLAKAKERPARYTFDVFLAVRGKQ